MNPINIKTELIMYEKALSIALPHPIGIVMEDLWKMYNPRILFPGVPPLRATDATKYSKPSRKPPAANQ
jgi:hypothetical protein